MSGAGELTGPGQAASATAPILIEDGVQVA